MGFLALVMAYGMRVSLSITITEMVLPTSHENESHDDTTCPMGNEPKPNKTEANSDDRYGWSEYDQVRKKKNDNYL